MRVLVTGSRNWTEEWVIEQALYAVSPWRSLIGHNYEVTVIHGGAVGADTLADKWAREYGYVVEVWKPEYGKYPGYLAPLKRNDAMLDSGITVVLAFMLGTPEKGGTLYTVNGAKQRRIPVVLYNWPGDPGFKA